MKDEFDLSELASMDLPEDPESLPLLGEPGYFYVGWSHLVAAYGKVGKTTLLSNCALEWVAEGKRVLWISEESEYIWKLRTKNRHIPKGLRIFLGLGKDPEVLRQRARLGDEDVVILDTVRHLLKIQNENDNSEVAYVMGNWTSVLPPPKTPIFSHHCRKTEGDYGSAISGAGAFLSTVDRALEYSHYSNSKNKREIKVTSRLHAPDNTIVELIDGKLGISGKSSQLTIMAVQERILKCIGDCWVSTKDLDAAIGYPKPSEKGLANALNKLFADSLLERDPCVTMQGARYKWRLRNGTSIL